MFKYKFNAVFFILILFLFCFSGNYNLEAGTFLFDASHEEMSGNADWVIDADVWDLNLEHYPCSAFANESNPQNNPTPDQSGITGSTPETYWTGGISSWGIDLVKAGHSVYTLPNSASITYGNGSNPYDLSYYDVFIIPEPQQPFSAAEITAITDFVQNGGGLFMVADHQTSDRNCSGWDSPHVYNDLMGVVISGGVVTNYGIFGLVFNVEEISALAKVDYWFDDATDNNVTSDINDSIIHGPFGDGSGGLGFFGATSMTIDTATNSTVAGHVWKTDAGGQGSTRVTFVTAQYGAGRIAAIGDSSPADDGTGDSGDSLYNGWDKASGGVANDIIHLNACDWLLTGNDTTPPVITSGPTETILDCTTDILWDTDEAATSVVEWGLSASYGNSETVSGYSVSHQVRLRNLQPGTQYFYRTSSTDPSGNGPTYSTGQSFTTAGSAAPVISSGPSAGNISGTSATITWQTNEESNSLVDYGLTTSYGNQETNASYVLSHEVVLTGLSPETTYHYRVSSTDSCSNGPTSSADGNFTTGASSFDISGWSLKQYDGTASFTFPTGTQIASGSYVIVCRNANQADFETFWGITISGSDLFFNSNWDGSCSGTNGCLPVINGNEYYELMDDASQLVDGQTIVGQSGNSYQRKSADLPANQSSSWTAQSDSFANPGSGMTVGTGSGVVISEWSDAGSYIYEFVELFNDNGETVADTTSPATVDDLDVEPVSSTSLRLTFTAVGDDGTTGTANEYDIRWSSSPIQTDAEFAAATQVSNEPAPQAAGAQETIDINSLTADTTYFFALKVADEVPNWSSLSSTKGATTAPTGSSGGSAADHLVISEIQVKGASDHDDEFIELYNPTDASVNLSGLSVQYKSAAGTSFLHVSLASTQLLSHHYYLITRPEYTGSVTYDQQQNTIRLSASGGHVFLVNSASALSSCTSTSIVDKIGYGTGNCPETSAAPVHDWGETIERAPGASSPSCGNGQDTDDNSADFAVNISPGPQNSTMSESPCSSAPGNVGFTLLIEGNTLSWGHAFNASSYKIRRAETPDFMEQHPVPDDTNLLTQPTGNSYEDTSTPAGGIYFYFLNAVSGSEESDN